MIDFTVLKTKISVSPLFFAVLTVFLLIDKNGIASSVLLFSFLHEAGHFISLLITKTFPQSIKTDIFGIRIKLPENLDTAKKCFVLSAGFAVNFLLSALFFALKKPLFGYINIFIGIFTAFPLPSTDGGSILKTILEEFLPQKAGRIFGIISRIFTLVLSLFLVFLSVFTKNYFIMIAVVYMLFCTMKKAA